MKCFYYRRSASTDYYEILPMSYRREYMTRLKSIRETPIVELRYRKWHERHPGQTPGTNSFYRAFENFGNSRRPQLLKFGNPSTISGHKVICGSHKDKVRLVSRYPYLHEAARLLPNGCDYHFSPRAAEIIEKSPEIFFAIHAADMRGMYHWWDHLAPPENDVPPDPNIVRTFYRVSITDNPNVVFVRVDRGGLVEIWAEKDLTGTAQLLKPAQNYPIQATFPNAIGFLRICVELRQLKAMLINSQLGFQIGFNPDVLGIPIGNKEIIREERIISGGYYFRFFSDLVKLANYYDLKPMHFVNAVCGIGDLEMIAALFFGSVEGLNQHDLPHSVANYLSARLKKMRLSRGEMQFTRIKDDAAWAHVLSNHAGVVYLDESRLTNQQRRLFREQANKSKNTLLLVDGQLSDSFPGYVEESLRVNSNFRVYRKLRNRPSIVP